MTRFTISLPIAFSLSIMTATAGQAQGMPPTSVETEPVQSMEFHDQITLVGRTEAKSQSQIVSEVSGRVIRIDALEGNEIRKGSVVVSIDPRSIQYELEAKRAEVEQARVQAELEEKDLERSENLFHQGAISNDQFDEDKALSTQTIELYNQRQAELKHLELDLENCRIRSPFDGYTVRKLIDVGEWVNPGTPVYELVDLSTIKVIVDLPEKHFGHVMQGSSVIITTSGKTKNPLQGKVTGIAPNASRETHTFPVIVNVANAENRLGGGMLVRVTLTLDELFTSLSVSKDAIIRQGAQTMIYTVAEGKAMPIPVQTSSTKDDRIAIQGQGLREGMPVVIRGNERIFPGSPVSVSNGAGGGPAGPGGSESAHPEGREGGHVHGEGEEQ
jgi:RND family efflux transporter MFP subunit